MVRNIIFVVFFVTFSFAKSHTYGRITEPLYLKECGSCHLAYSPELLNTVSWQKLLDTLAEHYGTDASVEQKDKVTLRDYLEKKSWNRDKTLYLRLSHQPWFIKEHRKIPLKYLNQSAVKSWSNCHACHTKADKGSYHERDIIIPNYGKWED